MALTPNYAIQEYPDSTGFILTDTTGDYNASTNPGGYGAPNIGWISTNYYEITLKTNDGTVIGAADTEYVQTLFNSARQLVVLASDYGLTTFDDQVIELIYTVRSSSGGAIQGTLDNKVIMFSKTEKALTNAFLSQPDFYWVNHPNDLNQLMFYKGLLYSYMYMTVNNIFNAADAGIKQLYQDSLNIHFTV